MYFGRLSTRLTALWAFCVFAFFAAVPTGSGAAELIMVERKGCHYCDEWKEVIGPIYPKTKEGEFAPLRMVNIRQAPPEGVTFARPAVFTPTFILVDEGAEVARIEGYLGEDLFWSMLTVMLAEHTDFDQSRETE